MTENDNKVNILMRSPVFRGLPKEALNAITRAVEDLVVPQHTIISREGDPGDSLYIISSGRVRIFGRNEKGEEIDLSIQGPGDTFGEMALLTGEPMSADVEVLEETHLMILSKDRFDRILRDFPDISPYDLEVANKLLLLGYKNVRILEGGLTAWEGSGYPVEEQAKK
jgi:CRP/FNR family transcriptional regulator, cyclic AMP receptor protein